MDLAKFYVKNSKQMQLDLEHAWNFVKYVQLKTKLMINNL